MRYLRSGPWGSLIVTYPGARPLHANLPAVKKFQTENEQEQLFVVPTTQVMQLFPEQEVQEAAQVIALPGQPNLAMRVLTLEGIVADLQERLGQLET